MKKSHFDRTPLYYRIQKSRAFSPENTDNDKQVAEDGQEYDSEYNHALENVTNSLFSRHVGGVNQNPSSITAVKIDKRTALYTQMVCSCLI